MSRLRYTLLVLPALMIAGLTIAACDESPTSPSSTDTTTTIATTTSNFEGTLTPGAASFYSFTVTNAGTVTVTLGSLAYTTGPAALAVPVRIGVGIPAGQGCAVAQAADVTPLLVPQLSAPVSTGINCVNVADIGRLSGPATFSVRFTHP